MNNYFYLFTITSSLLITFNSWSYPSFIGKGYGSCITCHYNPFGNGPLNDYGRAVSANTIAGRTLIPESVSNDDLSKRSGFLFNLPKNTWFRPAFDYRGLYLKSGINKKESTPRYINMQLDTSITLQYGPTNDYLLSATYAIIPDNSTTSGEEERFFRELYAGVRFTENIGLYIGKMDKVFGIRVPDHTAYSRSAIGIGQADQVHGVMGHYGNSKMDFGIHYYVGDLEKEEQLQANGYSTKIEYFVADRIRLGFSHLTEMIGETSNKINALIAKYGDSKGASILAEFGLKTSQSDESSTATNYQYFFMQNHVPLAKGLYFMTTFEQVKPNTGKEVQYYRITPGVQWFPVQRVELRGEIGNTKTIATDSVSQEIWSLLGQIHLWF